MQKTYNISTIDDLKILVKDLISDVLKPGIALALVGDLGAGKTTFVQILAEYLGVSEDVTSPTFVLHQTYELPNAVNEIHRIHHLDLYRLETIQDVLELGIEELFDDNHAIVCIEWADKIASFLPEGTVYFNFKQLEEETRLIEIISPEK